MLKFSKENEAYEKQMEEYQAKMKETGRTKSRFSWRLFYIFTKENDV
jgi:hypothetical protein